MIIEFIYLWYLTDQSKCTTRVVLSSHVGTVTVEVDGEVPGCENQIHILAVTMETFTTPADLMSASDAVFQHTSQLKKHRGCNWNATDRM